MNNRRNFLVSASRGVFRLLVATAATAPVAWAKTQASGSFDRRKLLGPSQMPEVVVDTHDGRVVRLYADLIKGQVVALNFMSINNEDAYPISKELAKVARGLGTRLGTAVRMISITNDPQHDTPDRLRAFAKQIGAPEGWDFVRASGEDHARVSSRLYHHGPRTPINIKIDVVHYGNDAVGVWSSFPSSIQPDDAITRIMSVMNGKPVSGPLKQAGPRRLNEPGPSFNNRVAKV